MARAYVALPMLLMCGFVPTAQGARWSSSGELVGGGGYDSNVFLQVAASPDSPNFHEYRGGFLRVNPLVAAALAGTGYRFQLRYDADLLQTFGAGRLFIQDGQLSLSLPELGPIGLRVAATAGRFDAGQFASDGFWSWGGRGQATVRLFDHAQASVSYEIDRRRFGDPAVVLIRSDVGQSGRLRLDATPTSALALGVEVEYLALRSELVDPTQPVGRLHRSRAGTNASFTPRPTVTLLASLWAGTQSVDGGDSDRQAGGDAAISLRASAALDVVARFDWLVNRNQTGGSDYGRQVFTIAVVGHVAATTTTAAAAHGLPIRTAEAETAGNQTPQIDRGQVRFRLRAAAASVVEVIGSWNGWATGLPRQRLRRTTDPTLWEGRFDVGPGEHRYRFLVDDHSTRPVDAPRYRPDDFGGEDGVLEVPDDPASARGQN